MSLITETTDDGFGEAERPVGLVTGPAYRLECPPKVLPGGQSSGVPTGTFSLSVAFQIGRSLWQATRTIGYP